MRERKHGMRSGETLVEVMASIVIFLLVMAMLQGAVSFCTNAQAKSREIRKNTNGIAQSLWGQPGAPDVGSEKTLNFKAESGAAGTSAFQVDVTLDQLKVPYIDAQGTSQTATFYLYGIPASLATGGGGTPDPGGGGGS